MNANRQIRLEAYRSGNSQHSGERVLSPLRLNLTGSILIAYEPASKRVKYYRLSRIHSVQMLAEPISYIGSAPEPDIFGWGGEKEEMADLALTLHAVNYLMEEHFETGKYLTEVPEDPDFPYRLRVAFKHPQGIGRFVMSMPRQVKILAPESLLAYVREEVKWWG
jgi:predicted DNA-binding transcriptional regulator YafY